MSETEHRREMEQSYEDACEMFDTSASEIKSYFRKEIGMVDRSEMSWAKLIELLMVYLMGKKGIADLKS